MDDEKKLMTKRLRELHKDGTVSHPCGDALEYCEKCNEYSEKFRKDGNILYKDKDHDSRKHGKILSLYNQSIAFAPNGSETLSTAYGNKSALLRHVCKYAECISEIDKALKITESDVLKIKLLCRKAECLTLLNSSDNQKCLERAKFILNQLDVPEHSDNPLKKLIVKTESAIAERVFDLRKKNKKEDQLLKFVNNIQETDLSNAVEVKYSEKYGLHLIAARDFEPGEIAIAEKPYCEVVNVTLNHSYIYCGHCMHYLWECVPCDYCTWCMFCSEQCKEQAWNEYHNIECSVVTSILRVGAFEPFLVTQLTLRTMLKAIHQAGSIMQLWVDLRTLDRREDYKLVSTNGEFSNYKRLYSLKGGADPDELDQYSKVFTSMLLILAKESSFFGKKYEFHELEKLMKTEEAMIVATLLMKTYKIICVNCHLVVHRNDFCESDARKECQSNCCVGRSFIPLTKSLMPLSCCPNVSQSTPSNHLCISFTLSPIKKGDLLFTSHHSIYQYASKSERQKVFRKRYGSDCDCEACLNDWKQEDLVSKEVEEFSGEEKKMKRKLMMEEVRFFLNKSRDIGAAHRVKKQLQRTWKSYTLPSKLLVETVRFFLDSLRIIYAKSDEMPGECAV